MNQGPRIYNLFPLLAGPLPGWAAHLARAGAMGFTWIFVNPFHQSGFSGSLYSVRDYYAVDPRLLEGPSRAQDQLRRMIEMSSRLGLSVMMDLVINHTAFDSSLIREHPDWFRRDARGKIVHPGAKDGKNRVVWRDLAEVDNATSPDREALWTYWQRLALHYAGMGFRGFRCDAAYQVPVALWRELIGAVKARHPDVLFFAETLGCTPRQTLDTAAAGFDFIFNSSKWWNYRDPWCVEQYAETAPIVPSVSFPESHDTPRLAAELQGDRAAVLQRYAFAAMFSTGVMMPIGFEYGFRRRLHVVQTRPEDWEAPAWDLTGAVASINKTKASLRPLNEEGPLRLIEPSATQAVGFVKETRDGDECLLVLLNAARHAPLRLDIPAETRSWGPLLRTDPTTGTFDRVFAGQQIELLASEVAIIHRDPGRVPALGDTDRRSGSPVSVARECGA